MPPKEQPLRQLSHLHLDYLVEIYHAEYIETNGQSKTVSSAEIATRMITSQSSVNRIIERLKEMNMIQYERYVGVCLTEQGIKKAHSIVRKQGIIESFLIKTLKFEWHEVSQEAKQLRHHVSDTVLQRMWDIAGKPQQSPFGDWLEAEHTHHPQEVILGNVEVDATYTIQRILTRQSDRLQYLSALSLVPGCTLHVIHKAPFDGPMQIQLEREYRILGHELSQMITVIPQA